MQIPSGSVFMVDHVLGFTRTTGELYSLTQPHVANRWIFCQHWGGATEPFVLTTTEPLSVFHKFLSPGTFQLY